MVVVYFCTKLKYCGKKYITMNFMNKDANIKQFQLVRFINENSADDHVMSKLSIVLRRDKIEAPYYMVTKIKLSTCVDMEEKGLIHAMDMLNHARRHNLTEEAYGKIRASVLKAQESDLVKISESDVQLKIDFMTRNDDEFQSVFNEFNELFDLIDNLVG